MLEIVKQPPCISPAVSLPSRAFLEMVVSSRDSSVMLFLFTSLNTGTTRPFGVSTATPMLMYFFSVSFWPSSDRELLKRGICSRAAATAFMMKTTGVNFTSSLRFSASAFCCLRNASRSVISVLSKCVTCGIITQLRLRFAPEIFWMRPSSTSSISPNLLKSTFGQGSMPGIPPPVEAGADSARLTASFT